MAVAAKAKKTANQAPAITPKKALLGNNRIEVVDPNKAKEINKANSIVNTSTRPAVSTPKAVNAMSPSLTSSVTGNQMKSAPARFNRQPKSQARKQTIAPVQTASMSVPRSADMTKEPEITPTTFTQEKRETPRPEYKVNSTPIIGTSSSSGYGGTEPTNSVDRPAAGFSGLQLVGDTDANNRYIQAAIDDGMSEEDADNLMNRWDDYWSNPRYWVDPSTGKYDYDFINKNSLGDIGAMDDGSVYDYDHMTADKMTGTQYRKYAEMGMGGRPIEEIDPMGVYSKRSEYNDYGFTPFTPDAMSYKNMVVSNAFDFPARLGSVVSKLREEISPDYQISYGLGNDRKKISGRDFDKRAAAYVNGFDYDWDRNQDKFLQSSGRPETAFELDDGRTVYVPDLVLSDGTRINIDDARRIYADQTINNDEGDYDDDIGYDYQNFLGVFSNKPARLNNPELFTENGINTDDLADNALDWTFGSLPISLGTVMPWLYSASSASSALSGVDPMSYNPTTNSYSLLAGNYDDKGNWRYGINTPQGERDEKASDETRYWNALGNLAVPLTENIAGNIGSDPFKAGIEKLTGKSLSLPSNPTVRQVLKNGLVGAIGEGIEEDVGNVFDELTQYGPAGMYANPLTDEEGNQLYDENGYALRNYDTPLATRLGNVVNKEGLTDLANSFSGGVAVDALMDLLMSPIPVVGRDTTLRQLIPAIRRANIRRRAGIEPLIEPEEESQEELANSLA